MEYNTPGTSPIYTGPEYDQHCARRCYNICISQAIDWSDAEYKLMQLMFSPDFNYCCGYISLTKWTMKSNEIARDPLFS